MKIFAFIVSISVLIFLFLKRGRINKKIFIKSLIFYFVISLLFFILKKTVLPNHSWLLVPIYASFVSLNAYVWVLFVARLIINKLIKFQIEQGNQSPFITRLDKNKSTIHLIYSLVFLKSIGIALYGIWLS